MNDPDTPTVTASSPDRLLPRKKTDAPTDGHKNDKLMSACMGLSAGGALGLETVQAVVGWLPFANSHVAQNGIILTTGFVVAVATASARDFRKNL
jgi:hypothetical protein